MRGHALEICGEEGGDLVFVARVLDGSLGLGLGTDLGRLEARLAPPELAVVVFLAVDRDGVAVEGLADEAVRRDDLAFGGLRRERVAQRREREVDLLLTGHDGALDGPRGGGDGLRSLRLSLLAF